MALLKYLEVEKKPDEECIQCIPDPEGPLSGYILVQ